jgi:hypothetical protein
MVVSFTWGSCYGTPAGLPDQLVRQTEYHQSRDQLLEAARERLGRWLGVWSHTCNQWSLSHFAHIPIPGWRVCTSTDGWVDYVQSVEMALINFLDFHMCVCPGQTRTCVMPRWTRIYLEGVPPPSELTPYPMALTSHAYHPRFYGCLVPTLPSKTSQPVLKLPVRGICYLMFQTCQCRGPRATRVWRPNEKLQSSIGNATWQTKTTIGAEQSSTASNTGTIRQKTIPAQEIREVSQRTSPPWDKTETTITR